ncbi:cAMP-dependent protein kinase regulatory subunit [Dictyocoela muelleri]|nr:cAMP-dependent protein kinase regulatory subunit [Dictyocoela muelleri]
MEYRKCFEYVLKKLADKNLPDKIKLTEEILSCYQKLKTSKNEEKFTKNKIVKDEKNGIKDDYKNVINIKDKNRVDENYDKKYKDQSIENKDQSIENKDQSIENKDQSIEDKDQSIEDKGKSIEDKDQSIEDKDQSIEDKDALDESIRKVMLHLEIEYDLNTYHIDKLRGRSFYNESPHPLSKPNFFYKDSKTCQYLHSLLKDNFLYTVLNSRQRRDFVNALERKEFKAEYELIREGTFGDGMYLTESGTLKVCRRGKYVTRIKPGDLFGEYAIMFDKPRSATIISETETVVWFISRENYYIIKLANTIKNWNFICSFIEKMPGYHNLERRDLEKKSNVEYLFVEPGTSVNLNNQYFVFCSSGKVIVDKKEKTVCKGDVLEIGFVSVTENEGFFVNRIDQ